MRNFTVITASLLCSLSKYWYWITALITINKVTERHLLRSYCSVRTMMNLSAVCFRLDLCLRFWVSDCGGSVWWRRLSALLQLFQCFQRCSGSEWSVEVSPTVSPLCSNLLNLQSSVKDFKLENLKWHPTSLLSSSKSNKWIHLTLDCISVDIT